MIQNAIAKGTPIQTLKEHTIIGINTALDLCNLYDINERVKTIIVLSVFLHDMGKYSTFFQKQIFKKENKPDWLKELKGKGKRHEIYSLAYTIFINERIMKDEENFNLLKAAILFTHYGNKLYWDILPASVKEYEIRFYEYPEIEKYELEEYIYELINKKEEIIKFFKEIIDASNLSKSGWKFEDLFRTNFEEKETNEDFIYNKIYHIKLRLEEEEGENFKRAIQIMGLVKKSDYASSAGIKFEKIEKVDIEKLKIYKTEKKFSESWQYEVVKNIEKKVDEKKHFVLVAPTGSGKSEFALIWHTLYSKKIGFVGVLPLRASLNMLYDRLKIYCNRQVDLLHSTAFIKYLKEMNDFSDFGLEDHLSSARLFVKPYTLCTPEQCMLTSLKYFGFDNVLVSLGNSTVVLDEIQAYTPEMNAILIRTLKQIVKMGGRILIMTATLPPYLKEILFDEEVGLSPNLELLEVKDENIVNLSGKEIKITQKIKNTNIKRHKIKIFDYHITEKEAITEIINRYKKIENTDKKILVVTNTINIAIEIYKELKSKLEGCVGLLHGRIKEKKKEEIIKEFEEGKIKICVATQVLEASVDIDADYLFTQLSPIESQIQRWGRIHRNKLEDYNQNEPNIYIYTELKANKNGLKDYTNKIYNLEICDISKEILTKEEGKLLSYKEERNFVEKTKEYEKRFKEYVERTKNYLKELETYGAVKKSEARELFRTIVGKPIVIKSFLIKAFEQLNEENEIDKNLKNMWKENKEKEDPFEEIKTKIEKQLRDCSDENERKKLIATKYRYLELILENSLNVNFDDYTTNKNIYDIEILEIPKNFEKEVEEYGWYTEIAKNIIKDKKEDEYII